VLGQVEVAILTELVKLGLAGAHPAVGARSVVTLELGDAGVTGHIVAHLTHFVAEQDPDAGLRRKIGITGEAVKLVTEYHHEG
jgi:hypothetical protein